MLLDRPSYSTATRLRLVRIEEENPGNLRCEPQEQARCCGRGSDQQAAGRDSKLPSFVLTIPGGRSPQSIRSTPFNNGSPGLMPLQFTRQADYGPFSRPGAPFKLPSRRPRGSLTPRRAWRPQKLDYLFARTRIMRTQQGHCGQSLYSRLVGPTNPAHFQTACTHMLRAYTNTSFACASAQIGSYTFCYASSKHARTTGKLTSPSS